jgi:hypothetical protein
VRTLASYVGREAARLLPLHVAGVRVFPRVERRQDGAAGSSERLPSRDELAERALATGDEHAIKFTDACFRERR